MNFYAEIFSNRIFFGAFDRIAQLHFLLEFLRIPPVTEAFAVWRNSPSHPELGGSYSANFRYEQFRF